MGVEKDLSLNIESGIAPSSWPDDVKNLYVPVKILGCGRFATVVLSRPKNDNNNLHALKVIGSKYTTGHEEEYARREIEILKELNHPNIVRLLHFWVPSVNEKKLCVAVMALSYAEGPTLEWILKYGGKLSLVFAQVVAAQLVDAVSYLHSRACVHRDIKPDNLVVTGASKEQDDIWDDMPNIEKIDLVSYRKRWHVTLIDFGLARALTPKDLQKAAPNLTIDDVKKLNDISSSQHSQRILNRSKSRQFDRQMSAVGNRIYAAPEILNGVHDQIQRSRGKIPNASFHPIDVTHTLSAHVSFYGLMADAYSIGNTIKYMLTGVQPDQHADTVIEFENSPIVRLLRCCCGQHNSSYDDDNDNRHGRSIQYRRTSQIPRVVTRLIMGLTDPDPQKRITVTVARRYPWIDDVLDGYKPINHESIDYLGFVLEADGNAKDEMDESHVQENDHSAITSA